MGEPVEEKKEGEGEEEEKKEDDEDKPKFNANLFAWSKQNGKAKHLAQVFSKFKQPAVESLAVEEGLPKCVDALLKAFQHCPSPKLVFLN